MFDFDRPPQVPTDLYRRSAEHEQAPLLRTDRQQALDWICGAALAPPLGLGCAVGCTKGEGGELRAKTQVGELAKVEKGGLAERRRSEVKALQGFLCPSCRFAEHRRRACGGERWEGRRDSAAAKGASFSAAEVRCKSLYT